MVCLLLFISSYEQELHSKLKHPEDSPPFSVVSINQGWCWNRSPALGPYYMGCLKAPSPHT